MTSFPRIGLLGFGEVGQILATDLAHIDVDHATYDIKFDAADGLRLKSVANDYELRACDSARELGQDCDLIISAVTAEQTGEAAKSIVEMIKPGTWFLDLNSAAPSTKSQAAATINNKGGRYVEGAVMNPVPPERLGCPILLGGPFAKEFLLIGGAIGFTNLDVFSDTYGKASAAKMCRSVMIKGIEALLSESLIAARAYGVEQTVLNSLHDLLPGSDWSELAKYMIGRTLEHGGRRAEEMREVAKTVADIGLTPSMSLATAERQDWAKAHPSILEFESLEDILDALGDAARHTMKGTAA